MITVQAPNGEHIQVQVPVGASAGLSIRFDVDARYGKTRRVDKEERQARLVLHGKAFLEYGKAYGEQRARGESDEALIVGTRLRVLPHGEGVYERFERSTFGANSHYIRFEDSDRVEKIELKKLKKHEWAVLALPPEHLQKLTEPRGLESKPQSEPESTAQEWQRVAAQRVAAQRVAVQRVAATQVLNHPHGATVA